VSTINRKTRRPAIRAPQAFHCDTVTGQALNDGRPVQIPVVGPFAGRDAAQQRGLVLRPFKDVGLVKISAHGANASIMMPDSGYLNEQKFFASFFQERRPSFL
jgi:hypothetical protein